MEINALFDLWDEFSTVMVDVETETTLTDFHTFPAGTKSLFIIGWFKKQNPYFMVIEHQEKGRRIFGAKNNPVQKD